MRFVLLLLALLLIPAFIAGHAWYFETHQAPALMQEVLRRLDQVGTKEASISRHMLDLEISGFVASPKILESLDETLLRSTPFHTAPGSNRLVAMATLDATLDAGTLRLSGWLPSESVRTEVVQRFGQIRPDLTLAADDLRISDRVALIDGDTGAPKSIDPWIEPLIGPILAPATLSIQREDDAIVIHGLLPEGELAEALLEAVSQSPYHWRVRADGLKESPYVKDQPFDRPAPLAAFVRSYFGTAAPGSFQLGPDGQPHLAGPATHELEAEWLALLRAVTGPAKVHTDFTYLPSIYHAPDRAIRSPLAPDFIVTLQEELANTTIPFPRGSKQIQAEEATRLAALSSILLTAGPALRLVVGGHPDPDGLASVESSIARMRAETVVSFLLEMGIPTTHIEPMAFELTPDSTTAGTVEILVQ